MTDKKVYVIGVGMTKFEKPGQRLNFDYPDMAKEAVEAALKDATIGYTSVEQACVGFVFGDSACGQRALYQIGMTGIPIYNVNNNCSTGSTALYLAKQFVESGINQCVLALGFEKMERGSIEPKFFDRTNPLEKHAEKTAEYVGFGNGPMPAQFFGNSAIQHMKTFGTTELHLAKIAYKNHKHSVNNPYAQFQKEFTLDEILKSPQVYGPLTKLQCCPTSDGAAAVILASQEFVLRNNLQSQAVEIVAMEMATDPTPFVDCMRIAGYDMSRMAADRVYKKSGISPSQVDVVELHDCFSANELVTYEALRLCADGEAGKLIDAGDNTYGGKYVINPSGGLTSKGHPLGATGLAQCAELTWQLRGQADKRQVPGAKLALQHNLGIGGAAVVTLYKKGFSALTSNKVSATSDDSIKKFNVYKYVEILQSSFAEEGDKLIKIVGGVVGFRVVDGPDGSEGYWAVDAKNGRGNIAYNSTEQVEAILTMSDKKVDVLLSESTNSQNALYQNQIVVHGNLGLALKLYQLLQYISYKKSKL